MSKLISTMLALLMLVGCTTVNPAPDRRTYSPPPGVGYAHPGDPMERPIETLDSVAQDGWQGSAQVKLDWRIMSDGSILTRRCLMNIKPTASRLGSTDGFVRCDAEFFGQDIIVEARTYRDGYPTINISSSQFVCTGARPYVRYLKSKWEWLGTTKITGRERGHLACSSSGFARSY